MKVFISILALTVVGCGLGDKFRGGDTDAAMDVDMALMMPDGSDMASEQLSDMASMQPGDMASVPAADMAVVPANFQILSALQLGRYGGAAVAFGQKMFVASGSSDGINGLTTVESGAIDNMNNLTAFAAVPGISEKEQRTYDVGASVKNYFYLFSGLIITSTSASVTSSTVERALVDGTGSLGAFGYASGVSIKKPRYGAAIAVTSKYVYVMGGGNENGMLFDDVEQAAINSDGTIGDFALTGHLNTAVIYSTGVTVGSYIYVIGGKNTSGAVPKVQQALINADGSLGAWTLASDLPSGRVYSGNAVVGNTVYVIGGTDGTTYLPAIASATVGSNGVLGAFATMDQTTWHLQTVRASPAIAVVGHAVVVIGGFNSTSTSLTSIERAVFP